MSNDSFYIETSDGRYFCCSPTNGFYFSPDVDDPNIVDGSELEIKYTKEDTIVQIAEQVKMGKGTQFSRKDLFQHPSEKAWLACERKTIGKTEDGEKIKEFTPFYSRKFKSVVCISKSREKCQGNASWRTGSKSVKEANIKAQQERKKRLSSAQDTARKLNFDPMKRLALYAMGDREALGLKEDVKPAIQMKAIETYLKYSHQQLKPYSPQEMEKLRGSDSGPRINVILPSNGEEIKGTVLEHKGEEMLQDYLKSGSQGSYDEYDQEVNINDDGLEEEYARLELPDDD